MKHQNFKKMKISLTFFIILFVTVLAMSQDKATIHFIRTDGEIASFGTNTANVGGLTIKSNAKPNKYYLHAFVNGNKFCKNINDKKYKTTEIAPGQHEITIKKGMMSKFKEKLKVNVESGSEHFIWMNTESKLFKDIFTIKELSKDEFEQLKYNHKLAKKGC